MSITLHEPASPGPPAWLALGVRALDTAEKRIGVAQLFRDDLGNVNANSPILRATHVLLRPVGDGLPWWAHVADLQQPPGMRAMAPGSNPLPDPHATSPLFRTEYSRTLPCEKHSAAAARALVHTALAKWGMDELTNDGALVVSELVANAAGHTRTRLIRVTVSRLSADQVRVAVVDKSRTYPGPRTAAVTDECGRGLAVVEAVTDRWGTDPLPWGKRVWGELERKASARAPVTAPTQPGCSDDNPCR